MPDRSRRGRRGGRALRWAEYLLTLAGVAMLAWAALLATVGTLAQRSARQALETAARVDTLAPASAPQAPPAVPAAAAVVRRGMAIADLSIPRLDLSAIVLHGSDAGTLRRGPGHLEGTALPGQPGNIVIAGHRDSFFSPLGDVQVGDDIFVRTPAARFHYRVTWLRVVEPSDLSVLESTGDETLTLITCYPFWVLGPAPDRFIVRARRVLDGTAAIAERQSPRAEPAPASEVRSITRVPPAVTGTAIDDATLVRDAIERFRLTYNARLLSREDVGPDGMLRFGSCDVTVADDRATAECPVPPSAEDDGPIVWIATLVRGGGQWAIRSIVVDDLTLAVR